MKKVRITVVRKACYPDLMEKYENPIDVAIRNGAGTRCRELLRWLDEKSSVSYDFLQ